MGSAKERISLNGTWQLMYCPNGDNNPFDEAGEVYEASVPGEVHLDMMRAGKIEDPFYGLNYRKCTWMEDMDWWYRKEFFVPEDFEGRKIRLEFDGLDAFATIWLNGELVGVHNNMFVPCSFEVTESIKRGENNILTVRLASPIKATADKDMSKLSKRFTPERLYARKSQISYGWDIGVRVVTIGIWRGVRLVALNDLEIEDVFVRTRLRRDGKAALTFYLNISNYTNDLQEATIELQAQHKDSSIEDSLSVGLKPGGNKVIMEELFDDPHLWWPNRLGEQNLYDLEIKVDKGDETIDNHSLRFGIREIALIQEPQGDGKTSFNFAVNGKRFFVRGTNWVPTDLIFSRTDRAKYKEIIELAVEQNLNMFRIWGGGIYEDPAFYELCDEYGILIWQDFMYACGHYPDDGEFLAEGKREAEIIVKSLRNHPCIALWCGDNENEWIYKMTHPMQREVLKKVCAKLDSTCPYWTSSPTNPDDDMDFNSPYKGDTHNWHHGYHYEHEVYSKDESRFVSEIGHLSSPNLETVKSFLPEDKPWPPDSEYWDYHYGTFDEYFPKRREKVDDALEKTGFGKADSLEEYIIKTQFLQALALKSWIEHYRRRKFECGGILYWNLHDGWPQFADAVTDYYCRKKIAYDFVRRAFSDVLPSFKKEDDGSISVWGINDLYQDLKGHLKLSYKTLGGDIIWERVEEVQIPSNSSVELLRLEKEKLDTDEPQTYLEGILRIDSEESRNVLFFGDNMKVEDIERKIEICSD